MDGVRVHRFRYAPRWLETLTHDQTTPDRIRERPWYAALVPGYVAAGSIAAAKLARSGRFDVVHAFWPLPHGLLGLAAKRAGGVPLVSTFFGVELTWTQGRLPALLPLLRRIVAGSDAVTAISTYTAARLREVAPQVEPVIIPFGAAVEPHQPPAPRPAPEAGGRPFELLFVGRLVERKGVRLLLRALAGTPATPPCCLHVVGDGPELEPLTRLTEKLRLSNRVFLHGFVAKEVLEARLAACDALVLPAVVDSKGDTEGLGVVLLEAMSYGKPVVASAAGGITDIVRHGENGLLVPPGDVDALAAAIQTLAADPAAAARMGAAALDDARERFSWEVIMTSLTELYLRVAAGKSPSGSLTG
jgi:glycosyltransferase involved in cell wall biosynthesis